MIFGSVFSKFEEFNATTADNKVVRIKNNLITRIGFKIFGLPHLGMRLRARKIIKNIPKNIDKMLDAGFGTGAYSFALSKRARSITALDISEEKVKYARKINLFKNISFIKGDLCNLKFKDESFSLVICSDVIEHIKNDELALSELARVLKVGGKLILTVPYNSKDNKRNYKKFQHEKPGYTPEDIARTINELNLDLSIRRIEFYSYKIADRISNLSYKIRSNIIAAIIFYPLYALALLGDCFIKSKEPNGMLLVLEKN